MCSEICPGKGKAMLLDKETVQEPRRPSPESVFAIVQKRVNFVAANLLCGDCTHGMTASGLRIVQTQDASALLQMKMVSLVYTQTEALHNNVSGIDSRFMSVENRLRITTSSGSKPTGKADSCALTALVARNISVFRET